LDLYTVFKITKITPRKKEGRSEAYLGACERKTIDNVEVDSQGFQFGELGNGRGIVAALHSLLLPLAPSVVEKGFDLLHAWPVYKNKELKRCFLYFLHFLDNISSSKT
jgi:hypothetical protein